MILADMEAVVMTPPWPCLTIALAAACAVGDACHIGVLEALELFQRHVQHRVTVMMALQTAMSIPPIPRSPDQHAGHLLVLAHIAADERPCP